MRFRLAIFLACKMWTCRSGRGPSRSRKRIDLVHSLKNSPDDMRVHAQPALAGDRMFFHRLKAFRNAQSQAYMQDMELRRVRSEADKAWHERRLGDLIGLYTSIASHLTESEKGKLDYAKKHRQQ